jgi:hypothetical protein
MGRDVNPVTTDSSFCTLKAERGEAIPLINRGELG